MAMFTYWRVIYPKWAAHWQNYGLRFPWFWLIPISHDLAMDLLWIGKSFRNKRPSKKPSRSEKCASQFCTDWWFGTFFVIFPNKKDNHPNWVIFFRGVETTNQLSKHVAFGQAEWNRIKSGWQMTKTGNSVRAGYTTWGLNKTSVRNNTVHCFTINRDDYARMHYNLLTRMGWWPSQAWSVWTYMSNFPVSVGLVVHEFQNSNATISTDRITICFFLVGSLIVFLNPSLFGQIDNYSELFPPLWANGKDKGKAWMQGQSGVSGERELQALQRMRCWPCHNP